NNAINNTLHHTNTVGDQFVVEYKGTGFVLYLRSTGSATSSTTFTIKIAQGDLDLTMSPWILVPGTTDLFQSTISGGTAPFVMPVGANEPVCYTRAPAVTINTAEAPAPPLNV